MRERQVLDVTELTTRTQGSSSLSWWGTLAYMLIEGTGLALMITVYFYLWSLTPEWPPGGVLPALGPGSWMTAILVVSLVPNLLLSRWATAGELWRTRLGLGLMSALGLATIYPRILEFSAIGVRWDDHAYGSVLWILLGLHTAHLLTDLVETLVLCVLLWTPRGNSARRFGDVADGALYWNFVVLAWLPIWACIYWVPRL